MPSGRTRYGRIALVERNADEEEESSEEEGEDAAELDSEEANDDTRTQPTNERAAQQTAKQGKLHVALGKSSELVCHVCGQKGHKAGFVGATYMDCPNKPCYLCKGIGHTTATCPHRAMPGAAAAATPAAAGRTTSHLLMQREQSGIQQRSTPLAPPYCPNWQVEAAILKLHTRRVCCLEYPGNSDSHVISGDKKGGIAIWNFTQVHDRTHYPGIHRALVNTVKWCSWLSGGFDCFSASSDGTARIFDIETGVYQTLADINPNGWHQGCKWNMFYGADANKELGALLAGDSDGKLYLFDPRAGSSSSSSNGSSSIVSSLQVHKAGSKVNSISVNPAGGSNCVLTAGGDHTVKLFDLRKLTSVKPPPASSSSPPAAAPAPAAVAAAGAGGSSRGRGIGSARGGRKRSAAAAAVGEGHHDENEDPAAAAAAAESGRGRGRGRSTRGRGSGGSTTAAAAAAAASSSVTPTKQSIRSAMAAAMAAAATAELAVMPHGRVVNHAVFSPSGRKILTTCQDNRLRIWDNVLLCQASPTREIVHSHDFNRYLTPFKAEWFHNDPSESRIICGRYISEDFGGIALHPIDIFDANTGGLLQQLTDLNLTTITPVNKPHPRLDIIISGSSRSLYKWTPQSDDDEADTLQTATPGRVSAAAADLVRRSAAAAAAVRSRSNFMCFDADPNGSGAKKRSGGSGTAGAKSVTKQKGPGAKSVTKGRGGNSSTAAGRGRKRGRGAAASAASDDEEGESDDSDD